MPIILILFLFSLSSVAQAADCPQGSRVLIKTQPEKAEVWLDGQKLADETPVVTPPLCVGRYRLEVKAKDYEPKQETLDIQVADSLISKIIVIEKPKPQEPQFGASYHDPLTGLEFALIPKGCFQMGSPAGEADRESGEGPQHRVCFDQPFYLSKTEVTQAQWEKVMGSNPAHFKSANRPVENVSWADIQGFIRKLNAGGRQCFGLPTEAQWEYGARAGSTTAYHFGNAADSLGNYAWYNGNSGNQTHPVGEKSPNAWGLHDMHGNVWEWVQDSYHSSYQGAPTDGSAWETNGVDNDRVLRGGSWISYPRYLRSAYRYSYSPVYFRYFFNGFRLVVSPSC